MHRRNDLNNCKFGKLTVIKENGRSKDRHILWECVCDCGKKVNVIGRDLITGHTQSCGCLQREIIAKIRKKHGDRDARLYLVWKGIKKRCENPKDKACAWYGAKGVKVCEEWHDYINFKVWALENGYDSNAERGKCTIDRKNPYGNYEPSNCQWVDMNVQANNKRRNYERVKNA